MNQKHKPLLSLTALFATAFILVGLPRVSLAEDAGDFLMSVSSEAIQKLNDDSISEQEKQQRFQELMRKSFDIPRISRFILGINWRSATPEQRKEFVQVFEETNTKRFLPLFAEYAGDKFQVTRVRPDSKKPNLFFVNSTLIRTQGDPISIEWRVTEKDGQYKILDAAAEGVSMALSLRQEYSAVVQSSGIDGLIAELRKQAGSSG